MRKRNFFAAIFRAIQMESATSGERSFKVRHQWKDIMLHQNNRIYRALRWRRAAKINSTTSTLSHCRRRRLTSDKDKTIRTEVRSVDTRRASGRGVL